MLIRLSKINLQYSVVGEGFPIINLHGWGGDHQYMAGFVEPIFIQRERKKLLPAQPENLQTELKYKRIYLDLPGGGLNRDVTPEWLKGSDQMLEVVLEFIDKIIPGEQFLLIGHSYGGYLARGVIKHRSDKVAGVLMVVPTIIAETEKRTLPQHVVLSSDLDLDTIVPDQDPEIVEWFKAMAVVQTPEVLRRIRDEMVPGSKSGVEDFLIPIRQTSRYAFSFEVDALEQPFDKPALILSGRQDRTNGFKDSWRLADIYTRATFVVLDRAGHLLDAEQTSLLTSLANEWLFRVEESLDK